MNAKIATTLIFIATTAWACQDDLAAPCRKSTDCNTEEFCLAGECDSMTRTDSAHTREHLESIAQSHAPDTDAEFTTITVSSKQDSAFASDEETPVETRRSPCSDAQAPASGDLVINEILASVPIEDGDANNDGYRDPFEDEFIELVNTSGRTLDLQGIEVRVDGKFKFVFEPHCLKAGHPIVLFGGGAVNIEPRDVAALTSDTRLSLKNSGGLIEITTMEGIVVTAAEYGDVEGRSWVLQPEIIGDGYVPHRPGLFSAGTCADGSPLHQHCTVE